MSGKRRKVYDEGRTFQSAWTEKETDIRLIMVICIAFIGGKFCGPHATGYVKIWPSSTKSLPTPDLVSHTFYATAIESHLK